MMPRKILFVVFLIAIAVFSYFYLNGKSKIRFLYDEYETRLYCREGSWYPLKKVPYKDTFSEYPQLGVTLFALPHILLSFVYGADYGLLEYRLVFSAFMLIFLSITVMLLYNLRGRKKYYAFLMFLPASLYFSVNRYDIFPVFLSVLSVIFISKGRYNLAATVLALGVLAKWYPLLLMPIFLNFYYCKYKQIGIGMLFLFLLTIFLGVLPTFFSGGVKAFLVPYIFQAQRGCNRESLMHLLSKLNLLSISKLWKQLFAALQFAAAPISAINKINTLGKIHIWSAISIFVFMLFSRIYSPQWILWVMPFLILSAQNKRDILLIIIFDLITYVEFPVVYDGFNPLLGEVSIIRTGVILLFIVALLRKLRCAHPL